MTAVPSAECRVPSRPPCNSAPGTRHWALILLLLLACNREQKQQAKMATGGDPDRGKAAIERYGCSACHNIPGVASAATSVVIAHVGHHTSTIRIGSGGIMLPNHAPLVIAEQFGTLEALFPGRIDLGVGRAPGGDTVTARALRRGLGASADSFPSDLLELQSYLKSPHPQQSVHAIPGHSTNMRLESGPKHD